MMSNINKKSLFFYGSIFLIYLITFLIYPSIARKAVFESMNILFQITPFLIFIFFLLFILNLFFEPRRIPKLLKNMNNNLNYLFFFIAGVLSHGPLYIWYPLLKEFKKEKTKNSYITVFLYSRSIKLPFLPVMFYYFGALFTLILNFYIILFSFFSGIIIEKIMRVNIKKGNGLIFR